jgi:hypothetical protein
MRQFALLLSTIFLFGFGTPAQDNPGNPFQTRSAQASNSSASAAYSMPLPAWLASPSAIASPSASAALSDRVSPETGFSASSNSVPSPDPQVVIGVRQNYPFQLYVGYTFLRFYEVPGTNINTNGFNYSIVYYPKDWIGPDGEFVLTLGDQYPYQAKFLLGMGGVRARMRPFQRNIDTWVHVLVGRSHFVPQTAYGKQGAFAYEVGGGVDLNTSNGRYAIRAGADMVGTRYFNTNQFSPKISVGFVYKF